MILICQPKLNWFLQDSLEPVSEDKFMHKDFIDSKEFTGIDFTIKRLLVADYECCTFTNCIFTDTDLSECSFMECEFNNCNLSMVKLYNTMFREVQFKNCKLLGLRFENCNKYFFEINFEGSNLNVSSFYQLDLKNTKFMDCNVKDVDFTEADLKGMIFDNCDLAGAIFENSDLSRVDFRTSFNYTINPESNRMEGAKFSLSGVVGLLQYYKIKIE